MLLHNGYDISPPLAPRFPVEILLLISELGSFDTRAKLVRCNKWLYKICTPLLYQEIYVCTPLQLLKLYRSRDAMRNFKKTETMFIDHLIFCSEEWDNIRGRRLQPKTYLARVLQAAVSLRRLQFVPNEQLDCANSVIAAQFDCFLRGKDFHFKPLFLPNLEILAGAPMQCSFTRLCYHRAVAFTSTLVATRLNVDTFPSLAYQTSLSPLATSRIACSPYRDLTATDVGRLLWETMVTHLRSKIINLSLVMRSADAVLNNKPSPVDDPSDWVHTVLSAAGYLNLEVISVDFEPLPRYQPGSAQYSALKRLQEILPAFWKGRISYPGIVWVRHPTQGDLPRPSHLADIEWTPDPDQECPEALTWWLEILGLHVSGARRDEELQGIVAKLRAGMRGWWPKRSVPRDFELYNKLRARTQ